MQYNNSVKTYVLSGNIDSGPSLRINAITFINKGTANANIIFGGAVLLPGATATASGGILTIEGNENEIDTTFYRVEFATTGTKELVVISKCQSNF